MRKEKINLEMYDTALAIAKGAQLRLIIVGESHPRYSRNPGEGEQIASAAASQFNLQYTTPLVKFAN